ncbi:MAG: hypothetical protein EHM45_04110, partial [Desulfobacteraceae bacterium]
VNLLGWAEVGRPYLPIMICASAMFLLGLLDDLYTIDPQHKLVGQIIISSVLLAFGFNLDWFTSKTINLCLTLVWIVGITNAFNLLDNMDGLSVGIALIAGLFLFLNLALHPEWSPLTVPILVYCAIFLGALAGFLIFNFNPASIFMGDTGSLFIGFSMACLTLTDGARFTLKGGFGHLLSVMAVPILILFIPLLDTGFVSLMRKLFSRPISVGGKDHSSHRMVAIGLSEKKAVITLYLFSIASGFLALVINYTGIGTALLLIALYLLLVILFWVYLAKVKVYEGEPLHSENGRRNGLTPIIVEFTYKRRLFEVLLDAGLIAIAYYAAYFLRFEGLMANLLGVNFDSFMKSLPIMIACQIFSFYIVGVYRGIWEATGISDLIDYVKAITLGTILAILVILFISRFQGFSRVVFIIYWSVLLILVSLSRLSFRLVDESLKRTRKSGKATLIYGAGTGGQLLLRELESNRDLSLNLIGFLDDHSKKQKRKMKGYPVFGGIQDLEKIMRQHKIEEIIISFRKGGEIKKQELSALCDSLNINVNVSRMEILIK